MLACLAVPAATRAVVRDRDHDRLPDRWERRHSLSTRKASAKGDPDHDRLTNLREYRLRTNPRRADTDGDGLRDRAEVVRWRTNPRRADTDRDGYSDGAEVRAGTNPRDPTSHPRNPAAALSPPAPAGAAPPNPSPTPAPTPAPVHCDRDATPESFASEVSAARSGETVCLASGSYGIWRGTDKAITIRPRSGATPSMGIHFTDGGGFTIDGGRTSFKQPWGLRIDQDGISPNIGGSAKGITIRNTDFSVGISIDGVSDADILLDHNLHHDLNGFEWSGAVHLSYSSDTPSGVTVQNSLFRDMSADGIPHGPAMRILNNEFSHVEPTAAGGNEELHTDAIQANTGCSGGVGSVIEGNYIHDGEQAIGAFDGTCAMTIEDNVVQNFDAHWITLGGDRPGSTVSHNTLVGPGQRRIDCTSKPGFEPSLTSIRDNIAGSILVSGDVSCSPGADDHNMLSSADGLNFAGTPRFVGGANPTSYAGFRLALGSPGKNAASDGRDVGIR